MEATKQNTPLPALGGFVPCFVSIAEAAHERRAERTGVTAAHVELAVARQLRNVDGFADMLASECLGRTDVESERATRMPGRLLGADTAVVLHALVVAADRHDEAGCLAAARLLVQRYLLAEDDRIQQLAAEYAAGA